MEIPRKYIFKNLISTIILPVTQIRNPRIILRSHLSSTAHQLPSLVASSPHLPSLPSYDLLVAYFIMASYPDNSCILPPIWPPFFRPLPSQIQLPHCCLIKNTGLPMSPQESSVALSFLKVKMQTPQGGFTVWSHVGYMLLSELHILIKLAWLLLTSI